MSALKKNEGFKKRQSAAIEKLNSNPSPTLYLPFRSLPYLSQAIRGEIDATLTTKREVTDLVNQLCLQSSPFEARENPILVSAVASVDDGDIIIPSRC
jgi:hypothetical protein